MKKVKNSVTKIVAAALSAVMPLGVFALGACDGTKTPPPDEHLHTLEATAAVDATCTAAGNSAYWYCDGCEKYFSDAKGNTEIALADTVIAAKGHKTEKVAANPADCTTDGNIEYWHCTGGCDKNFVDAAATQELTAEQIKDVSAGHDLHKNVGTPADCTTDGTAEYWHCEKCGNDYTDESATTEMSEADKVIAAHHTLTHHDAVAVSWEADGSIEHWTCGVCGKYFADETAQTETNAAATTVARETAPTGGTALFCGNAKANKDFFTAANWATFGAANLGEYGNGTAVPALGGEANSQYLEFTKAARFELFHVTADNTNFTHLGESSTTSNGKWGNAAFVGVYGKTYVYNFDVTADGAFAFEVFGLSGGKADRTGQGTSLLFDGNKVELYCGVYDKNNGKSQEKRAVATLSDTFDFGDGAHHDIVLSINRSEVTDGESVIDYRIYVDGYMLVFVNEENVSGKNAAKADGSINITIGNAGMGQRLSVIPEINSAAGAETTTYSTVRIHSLDIARHGDEA